MANVFSVFQRIQTQKSYVFSAKIQIMKYRKIDQFLHDNSNLDDVSFGGKIQILKVNKKSNIFGAKIEIQNLLAHPVRYSTTVSKSFS